MLDPRPGTSRRRRRGLVSCAMAQPRTIATVSILALCQALTMTCSALVISITALVGDSLARGPG